MTTDLDRLDHQERLDHHVGLTRVVRDARRGPRRRLLLVITGLAVAAFVAFAVRVLLGDYTFTIPDFFRILFGEEIPGASYMLMERKLPRALLGVLVGLAFGLAGAIFQTTLRNPLASPDLLGIGMGASAAAAFAIIELHAPEGEVALWGLGGAIAVALLVRVSAGRHSGVKLVLVGVIATFALQAVIQYLFTRANVYDAHLALHWLTGSLNAATWLDVRLLTYTLVALLPVTVWLARGLSPLELGDDAATALGLGRHRADALLFVGVLLTAAGVAAAGPIAFVPFLAGPIARYLNAGRPTLLGSALTGAAIVVGADYLADYAMESVNFPVGVVTGALGAPFLLWLLVSGRTGRRA